MIIISREFYKDPAITTDAIVAAGLPQEPSPGARFYGVSATKTSSSGTVLVDCYDDLTAGERTIIEGILDAP